MVLLCSILDDVQYTFPFGNKIASGQLQIFTHKNKKSQPLSRTDFSL